jgi:hypothetical protein
MIVLELTGRMRKTTKASADVTSNLADFRTRYLLNKRRGRYGYISLIGMYMCMYAFMCGCISMYMLVLMCMKAVCIYIVECVGGNLYV